MIKTADLIETIVKKHVVEESVELFNRGKAIPACWSNKPFGVCKLSSLRHFLSP